MFNISLKAGFCYQFIKLIFAKYSALVFLLESIAVWSKTQLRIQFVFSAKYQDEKYT